MEESSQLCNNTPTPTVIIQPEPIVVESSSTITQTAGITTALNAVKPILAFEEGELCDENQDKPDLVVEYVISSSTTCLSSASSSSTTSTSTIQGSLITTSEKHISSTPLEEPNTQINIVDD